MKFVANLPFNEYEKFEQSCSAGRYMQSRGQYNMNKLSKKTGCLGVIDDDDRVIAGAFYFVDHARMGDIYSVWGGPLMDYDDEKLVDFFFENAERFFKQQGALAFRFTPVLDVQQLDDQGQVVAEYNENVRQHLINRGYRNVPQNPVTDNRMPKVGLGYEYRKNLSEISSVKELRATYDKRARNDVKRAERFGVYLERIDYDHLAAFKKHTEDTAEQREYHDQTLDFYQHAYKEFKDNVVFIEARLNLADFIANKEQELAKVQQEVDELNAKLQDASSKKLKTKLSQGQQQIKSLNKALVRARNEQKENGDVITLSGGMFYIQPQEISYMFSFTNKQFSNYYGQHYLMDHMMQMAIERGIPTYNFYMVTGKFDGTDGVLKFKQLFKGATFRTMGWFEKPLQPMRYGIDHIIKTILGHGNDVK